MDRTSTELAIGPDSKPRTTAATSTLASSAAYGDKAESRILPPADAAVDASAEAKLDDDDYPAYSMGRAAEILGVSAAFLRSLGAAKLIEPQRSNGGHRRYSRYQLRLAARARELVDQGTALEAACRIIVLEDQLAEALRINNSRDRPADH